jgi:predicted nucleic acid-binding protein
MPNGRMSCFVDTNVLVYTVDESEPEKQSQARIWLDALVDHEALVLSPQSINEFYRASRRRFPAVDRQAVISVCEALLPWCLAPLNVHTTRVAWALEEATKYHWYDCLLLAAAELASCRYFLSEDMQRGRKVGSLIIVDPFVTAPNEILDAN